MKITVELQDNYSYSFWPVIVCILAVIGAFIVTFLVAKAVKKIKSRPPKKTWQSLKDGEKNELRIKYYKLLEELLQKVQGEHISLRHCYQKLSKYVREFVADLSGVKVNKCTLNDIKQMNMPVLASLIEEFYEVEFAEVSVGDAEAAIAKTKRIIETWN